MKGIATGRESTAKKQERSRDEVFALRGLRSDCPWGTNTATLTHSALSVSPYGAVGVFRRTMIPMDSTSTSPPGQHQDCEGGTCAGTDPFATIPAPRTAPDDLHPSAPVAGPAVAAGPPVPGTGAEVPDDLEEEITYASLYQLSAASRSGGLARGNLAVLIRYWTREAGAAKVGWGRSGDLLRCFRLLARYVPPNQVKGFCARLHKRATGKWPGPGRRH